MITLNRSEECIEIQDCEEKDNSILMRNSVNCGNYWMRFLYWRGFTFYFKKCQWKGNMWEFQPTIVSKTFDYLSLLVAFTGKQKVLHYLQCPMRSGTFNEKLTCNSLKNVQNIDIWKKFLHWKQQCHKYGIGLGVSSYRADLCYNYCSWKIAIVHLDWLWPDRKIT